jgi:hypothetical protein
MLLAFGLIPFGCVWLVRRDDTEGGIDPVQVVKEPTGGFVVVVALGEIELAAQDGAERD